MVVIGNIHISKCLPNGGCSILDYSGEGFVHLTAGFWGSLQLVCHVLYSWVFIGICAAYYHPSHGCSYDIKVHGPGGIVLDDSTSVYTGNPRCHSSNSWYISRDPSIWLCGLWHFCIDHGVDKTSGQCRRLPYHQYSGGQKCWYGGSSWLAGRQLTWNEWGGSAPQPGHPILPGNSNSNRCSLLPLSWGIQHPAEYSCRGWPVAVYGPIHFETLQYVSFGNGHKFSHSLAQFSYTLCHGVSIWACQWIDLLHPVL